jgi:hypothetical protein
MPYFNWPDTIILPPNLIQTEQDPEFELCLFGRVGQRRLVRGVAESAASAAILERRSGRTRLVFASRDTTEVIGGVVLVAGGQCDAGVVQ